MLLMCFFSGFPGFVNSVLETSDVTGGGPELFLYQSGYLTIKHCDEFGYILGIPNEEVRQALNEIVGYTQGRRACDRT